MIASAALKQGRGALLLFPILCALLSCGIDEYIYLEPATKVVVTDNLKVTVQVPAQSEYFDEYLLYYKLYPSIDGVPSGTINSNIGSIENANENNPDNLESVLKGLSFKTIAFDWQNANNPLDDSAAFSFVIDFNTSAGPGYANLLVGGTTYRMLRNQSLDLDSDEREFTLASVKKSYTAGSSDCPADVVSVSSAYEYCDALLFVVASGHDTNFSILHSTALEVGVFRLQ